MGAFSLIVVINLLNRSVIELCVENATQLFQGSLRPSTSFREGTIGSGVEIGRRIRTQKQKRGVENQVHPGQGENLARELLTLPPKDPKRIFQGNSLLRRLVRTGVLSEDKMKLDYVLSLKVDDFLERRLQTQVMKLGLARSIHHARVLIRQRHIRVKKQIVNVPSYMVRVESQKHIDFAINSSLGGGKPGRVKRANAKKAAGGGAEEEYED